MGFWESFQWSLWKIQAFFGDEDAAVHAASLQEVVLGTTEIDREINRIVDSEKVAGPRIPFFSDLKDTLENAMKGIGGLAKNLPIYVLIALLFMGAYLLLMGRKGKSVL